MANSIGPCPLGSLFNMSNLFISLLQQECCVTRCHPKIWPSQICFGHPYKLIDMIIIHSLKMVVICSKSMDWVSVIESGEEVCDGRILNLIFIVWRITGWRGTTCEWLRQGVSHCCWLLHLVASWIVPLLAPPQTHMNRSICCHGNVADMPNGSPIISVLTVTFVPSAD